MVETLSIIGANALTVTVAGFMVKKWMTGVEDSLKSMDAKLDDCIDKDLCHERQAACKDNVLLHIDNRVQKAVEQCTRARA